MGLIRTKKNRILILSGLVACLVTHMLLFTNKQLQSPDLFEFYQLKEQVQFLDKQLQLCTNEKYHKDTLIKNETLKLRFTKHQDKLHSSNEADLYSFSAYTRENYFSAELGIYDRRIFKLAGIRKKYLSIVIKTAIKHLLDKEGKQYNIVDFRIGFERSTPFDGHQCELYFKNGHSFDYISLEQPLHTSTGSRRVNIQKQSVGKQVVNFILPLSEGVRNRNALRLFLASFELVVVRQGGGLATLTIVYQGISEENEFGVEKIVFEFRERTGFKSIQLIKVRVKEFSRANLLEVGVQSCCSNKSIKNTVSSNLLFFCDVDVLFNVQFLDLCRLNARQNKRVYFPILYSYYNSQLSKRQEPRMASLDLITQRVNSVEEDPNLNITDIEELDLLIDNQVGYWRDTGFGMVCLHDTDFWALGGFGDKFRAKNGWGGEDVHLVRQFLKSSLEVHRVVTPGLFHLYHKKECLPDLNPSELDECIAVKIKNEASLKSFGMMYFKDFVAKY